VKTTLSISRTFGYPQWEPATVTTGEGKVTVSADAKGHSSAWFCVEIPVNLLVDFLWCHHAAELRQRAALAGLDGLQPPCQN
jgi:hypothetical protein